MKVAVCVKAVPDAATGRRIDPATNRLDRSGELTLSDFDSHAVEEGLRVKEAAGDLVDDADLRRRGRLQQRKAQARDDLARAEDEADRKAAEIAALDGEPPERDTAA